jgi:site-specific DNA-cytosine methylase
MGMAGVVDMLWAIERNSPAARTFKLNHPNAIVFTADANELLDRAIRRENGEKLEPLIDADGNVMPELPRPGEVDILIGGKFLSFSFVIKLFSISQP